MPLQKIMAFFMHEKEEALCRSLISNQQYTESYIMGEVEDEQLEELRKNNIVVQVLDQKPPVVDLGRFPVVSVFKWAFNNRSIITEELITEDVARFPAYYKFSADGPLLEDYKKQLAEIAMKVLEFIPPDAYLVRVDNAQQLRTIRKMPFVKSVTYYSEDDTFFTSWQQLSKILHPKISGKEMMSFDILLHTPEELEGMLEWLQGKAVSIAGSAGNKIRIYLLEDSPLQIEIPADVRVKSFSEYIPPRLHNNFARTLTGLDTLLPDPLLHLEYNGNGQVIGVADTGIDDAHPDFINQLSQTPIARARPGNYSDPDGHGTHVAGTIVGTGASSGGSLKGTAPGAKLFFQSILDAKGALEFPLQLQTLFQEAYDKDVRIHNNSWGSSTESKYTVNSVEVDDFVWKNKDMLLVFSVGNDGNAYMPTNVPPGFPDFLSIGSPASAKNVLAVGASRSSRTSGGYASLTYSDVWPVTFPDPPMSQVTVSGDSNGLACFSSRGPCDDLRIKPDVVAPGTDIASCRSSIAPPTKFWGLYPGNPQYAFLGGTSMAAPIVSGCAAVVREFFQKKHAHAASAALLKATIINGCKKLTGIDCVVKFPDLPNYNQGFGMVDMTKTIPSSTNNFYLGWIDNYYDVSKHFTSTGKKPFRLQFTLPSNTWLRICMAYTDYPGRGLQNNLNLILDYNPTNQKWTGNQSIPSVLITPDITNNVEVIGIENAAAGEYTVQVAPVSIISDSQDFALVITAGDPGASYTIL